ncbi:MAG TPA: hypothetical protein DCS43_11860 [Verrucomicrobia bacterium]|nr:hypothetical protein [Verrucomicrobiota bacterium]
MNIIRPFIAAMLLLATRCAAQTVIWEEPFTSQLGKGISTGHVTNMTDITQWSVAVHDAFPTNAYLIVSSNTVVKSEFLEGYRLAGECVWRSEAIDISAGPVDLSLQIQESKEMAGLDWIRVHYALDGTNEIQFSENGSFSGDYGTNWITARQPLLQGTNVMIVVRMYTTAADKNHRIDNVRATSSTAIWNMPPSLALVGGGTSRYARLGEAIAFTVTATNVTLDATNDLITLTAPNLPAGALFAATNGFSPLSQTFSWTPSTATVQTVTFYAADKDGTNRLDVSVGSVALQPPPIWINELHCDNTGIDTNEGVEIAGPARFDLSGGSLVFYNGANGLKYATLPLSGLIDSEDSGFGAIWFAQNNIQNEKDGIALIHENGGAPVVVQFISYEGSFRAVDGPAAGWLSTDIGVQQSDTTAIGLSLQLTGTGSEFRHFFWIGPTNASPGQLNAGQTFRPKGTVLFIR